MPPVGVLVTVISLVILASLVGGFVPYTFRLTHTRLQMLLSFVGGTLIGVGVLHMLPHGAHELGSFDLAVTAMLAGLVGMFFLTRIFHVHHHGSVDEHSHDDDAPTGDAAIDCQLHGRPMSWIALAIGLGFHSLLDGVALASIFAVSGHKGVSVLLLGAGALLAIVLHKPFDSLSLISVMIAGGVSRRYTMLANLLFSLVCPLGIGLFYLGIWISGDNSAAVVGWSLGISAGAFLCIALGDILPEVRFHSHDRLALSICFVAGILMSAGLRMVEPSHQHDPAGQQQHGPAHLEEPAGEDDEGHHHQHP
jgi:zinc and cadmium transporter